MSLSREPDEAKVSCPGVCPAKAGVFSRREPYQGKSQRPVARRAGGRETNLLKPLDSLIHGMGASLQAIAQANAEVAPKVRSPGGRACNRKGEGSMGKPCHDFLYISGAFRRLYPVGTNSKSMSCGVGNGSRAGRLNSRGRYSTKDSCGVSGSSEPCGDAKRVG